MSIFDEIKTGLKQAIEHENKNLKAKKKALRLPGESPSKKEVPCKGTRNKHPGGKG